MAKTYKNITASLQGAQTPRDKKIVQAIIAGEIKRRGKIYLKVFGGSMSPVIKDGSVVKVCKAKKVKTGDIVCYRSGDWFLVHRVKSVDKEKGYLLVEGDSRDCVVHKIRKSSVIGLIKESIYNKILRIPALIMKKTLKTRKKPEKRG